MSACTALAWVRLVPRAFTAFNSLRIPNPLVQPKPNLSIRPWPVHAQPIPPPGKSSPTKTDGVDDLSYRQARTALDLTLAALQGGDLEVEAMADLYRRAQQYAERCETVLDQVEQEVMQWDPQDPEQDPHPLSP